MQGKQGGQGTQGSGDRVKSCPPKKQKFHEIRDKTSYISIGQEGCLTCWHEDCQYFLNESRSSILR